MFEALSYEDPGLFDRCLYTKRMFVELFKGRCSVSQHVTGMLINSKDE